MTTGPCAPACSRDAHSCVVALQQQRIERVITQADFLFTAADVQTGKIEGTETRLHRSRL